MEKLAKKLSILILFFACFHLEAISLSLLSISPHTHDLYTSAPSPPCNPEEFSTLKTGCKHPLLVASTSPNRQMPSQNDKVLLPSIGEIKAESYLSYSLLFLYAISLLLLLPRLIKPFLAKKT